MLQFERDNLEGVDEGIASYYEQTDSGKYRLKVEGIDPADELKSALQKEREERKAAKERLASLESEKKKLEEQTLLEKQEFKTLYERETEAKTALQKQLEELSGKIQKKETKAAAMSIALQLTKDTKRAELLTEIAEKNARYGENGVSFELGGVPVESDKLVEHLKASYPFLVDGSGATGTGATGQSGTPGSKQMARADFDRMNPARKADFMRDGGKII